MMLRLLLASAGILFLLLAPSASSRVDGVIAVDGTLFSVHETAAVRSDLLLLWNKNVRSRPIGHGALSCAKLGTGGLLGAGMANCRAVYVLPRGKIIASGLTHGFQRYTLVIAGGSGIYTGNDGIVFVRRSAPGVQRLVFRLS